MWLAGAAVPSVGFAQEAAAGVPSEAEPLEDPAISGGTVARLGRTLFLSSTAGKEAEPITIPRMYASLRAMEWITAVDSSSKGTTLKLQPELDSWIISWKERPAGAEAIALHFDQRPVLASEVRPIIATGDGSLMLPAHRARTSGEKIRYEPQTFKNTVGYWVGKQDSARWEILIVEPGKFNVGILQGCGAGQGGSQASLSLLRKGDDVVTQVDFEVLETGHFQNFQWRHVGVLEVLEPGKYQLQIAPQKIHKAALMDVRAVHLVPVPES